MAESELIGKPVDGLTLKQRWALSGKWVAVELYSPERLPLRLIQAVGTDARDCIRQLRSRSLEPTLFEYLAVDQPYTP